MEKTVVNIGTSKGNVTGVMFEKAFEDIKFEDVSEVVRAKEGFENAIIQGWALKNENYHNLIKVLRKVGMTKDLRYKTIPDYTKLAEITGHSRSSLKVMITLDRPVPRWLLLVIEVGLRMEKKTNQTD